MSNFKCCKTKSIPSYYICTHCLEFYHKACVMRNKKQFKFLKDHKIICCENQKETIEYLMTSEEKSVLEQTLGDLTEDTVAKDKYIEKLKNDLKIFTEDALKAEKEMQELLDQQNVFLKIANEEIDKYKKSLDEINSITKSSAATQTCISAIKHTGIQVSPEVASKCIAVDFTNSTHLCNELDRFENRTSFNRKDIPSSECTTIVNKPRLLLISGYHGKNISKFIHHQSQKFIVSSIGKPMPRIVSL
ncbi:hypothetical protein JTB14_027302 [Gonioctena quinquepunctata]|nr:hypothetical protein JTB14_027302 [Gonioctena quinquepunctata]